jgi:dihydrofolate reductase
MEMRKLILRMAVTVDGVVAPEDPKAGVFDFSDDEVWRDTFSALENVDTMLIGAGMHREYLSHWQAVLSNELASPNERKFAALAEQVPHFVVSRSLLELEWPNATVLEGGVEGISNLKAQAKRDIMLWGGATVAALAIEAGVVDEYHFVTHPVIAGRGKKLFADVVQARRLRHQHMLAFPSGIVVLKYARQ